MTSSAVLSPQQFKAVMLCLITGVFVASLDQTVVGTAAVRISNDLGGYDLQVWIVTAYLVTMTTATLFYGKLSDIHGRRPVYLIAVSLFIAGSIASACAGSMYQLAAFRAVQGLGAGGLMSLAVTIVGDLVPPRERARYQGTFYAAFGVATVLGPVLGGVFAGVDSFAGIAGWRWVFLLNVPIGGAALVVTVRNLRVEHALRDHRIDWRGGLVLLLTAVPLLLGAEQGTHWGWASGPAIACYVLGAAGIAAYLVIELLRREEALLPLRLFRSRAFGVGVLSSVSFGVVLFGTLTMLPQYFQVVRGFSPMATGGLMLPAMLGLTAGSVVSGQVVVKTGRYKVFPVLGGVFVAAASLILSRLEYDTPLWSLLAASLMLGLGLGFCIQALVIAVQNAGAAQDLGVASAAATFFRQIGGIIGVAAFLAVLFQSLPLKLAESFGGHTPPGLLASLQQSTTAVSRLPEPLRRRALEGLTGAISTTFLVAAAAAIVTSVIALLLKEVDLGARAVVARHREGDQPACRGQRAPS
jgi:EmrB/QacA subfamily drug resistance transporter